MRRLSVTVIATFISLTAVTSQVRAQQTCTEFFLKQETTPKIEGMIRYSVISPIDRSIKAELFFFPTFTEKRDSITFQILPERITCGASILKNSNFELTCSNTKGSHWSINRTDADLTVKYCSMI